MSRLDQEHDVIALAKELGLRGNPVEAVVRYCQERIEGWVVETGEVRLIADLESLVCERLGLMFEEFRSDEELTEAIKRYTSQGEGGFAAVKMYFDEGTFGTLVERRKVNRNARDRYVAFIDCRGEKASRRFFTRWHEIAHLLTLTPRVELPVHRSVHDPVERLMDEIAGEIGFFESLFRPLVTRHCTDGLLSLAAVESVRKEYCSEASFQATLFACQRRLATPVVYVEAGMGYKADEERELKSNQMTLFEVEPPEAKLRVKLSVRNTAAMREKFQVAPNMRVPESSVIYRAFSEACPEVERATENMNSWESKKGGCLPACEVDVEARRIGDRVIALVQPVKTQGRKSCG